jgi:DedD protein
MNLTNEERKRSHSKVSNGWLATLGGAALLVAVGFGVGLVAGTAYEEPALVADHLSGNTTEVALGPVEPEGAAGEDVAAAPPSGEPGLDAEPETPPAPTPLGAGALEEAPEAQAVEAASARKPAVAAKPAAGGFSIQVGAFGSESTARQLAGELGKQGYHTYVTTEGGGARYKVRVGPIASRAEAEKISTRLKSEHRLPTWILASGKS